MSEASLPWCDVCCRIFCECEEPESCAICVRTATCYYPPYARPAEATPSCGSPRCEIAMQAATDYHEDVGNR